MYCDALKNNKRSLSKSISLKLIDEKILYERKQKAIISQLLVDLKVAIKSIVSIWYFWP